MFDEILTLSKKLISIPSVETNTQALQKIINLCASELDRFTVERFERNNKPSLLAYVGSSRPKQFNLILNGHVDVVEGKKEQFTPYTQSDKLIGRGASDMKSAVATELILFKHLAKKLPYSLGLQIVSDEEIGGTHGTKYQVEQGVATDFVLIGEHTNLSIISENKGTLWVRVKILGTSAHAAYPWKGSNSVHRMVQFVNMFKKKFPEPKTDQWKSTVTVSRISTPNETFNKIPHVCEAGLDIRFLKEDEQEILKLLKHAQSENGVEVEIIYHGPAHKTPQNHTHIQTLTSSIKDSVGKKPGNMILHGGSDLSNFAGTHTDGIEFGPVGEGKHSVYEWVSISGLKEYMEILENFLKNLQQKN